MRPTISYDLDLLKNDQLWRVGNNRARSYKPVTQQGICIFQFVSELLNANGSWNLELLNSYFLPCNTEEILKIRASPRQHDDILAWGWGKFGAFSSCSVYNFVFEESIRERKLPQVRRQMGEGNVGIYMIWKLLIPPTIIFLPLPTWKNKNKIRLEKSKFCLVCDREQRAPFVPYVGAQ